MKDSMKTAVTVLQEMMVKLGKTPEYEFIAQSGPQHQAMFEYRCVACGVSVTANARSKKEAKQEVARVMLQRLSACGHEVPPPYSVQKALPTSQPSVLPSSSKCQSSAAPVIGSHSYVALLKDLCEEYKLPAVDYDLIGDTGPPHMRQFTMQARVGGHMRQATSSTKKAARQQVAELLYKYLRENLARVTEDYVEEEAVVRAHEKAMERYTARTEEAQWRPDLGQVVTDYHLGLVSHCAPEAVAKARAAAEAEDVDSALRDAVAALGLRLECAQLSDQPVFKIGPTSPALAFFSAERALHYVRTALQRRSPHSPHSPNSPDASLSPRHK